jgi:hypothetical protein
MPYDKKKMERIKNTVTSAAKSLAKDDVYSRAEKRMKDYKAGKLGRIARLKRTAKELIGGKKTYLKKKKVTTTRTKHVTRGLEQAGVSKKKIKKLRGGGY